MLAEEDVLFQKVSDALYLISENREIAEQCRRTVAWDWHRGTLYREGDRSGEILFEDCDAGGGELIYRLEY